MVDLLHRGEEGMSNNNIYSKRIKNFPAEDGLIESIVIGWRIAKISFQTWDSRRLVLIYENVENLYENDAVFIDIGGYTEEKSDKEYLIYRFYNNDNLEILSIKAASVKILETGGRAGINDALFDVGTDYVGGQPADWIR